MIKYILFAISMFMVSCTSSGASNNSEYTGLSINSTSMIFESEGGQQAFTVTSSAHFHIIPGDVWLTVKKNDKDKDGKTEIIVTAEKNTSSTERKTRISVVAGDEKKYVDITQKHGSSMLIALSFDDGPNDSTTPEVLDILEEFDVPASFFVIGQNINESTAEQMKRAISLGCEVQNHSFTHSHMTQLSTDEVIDELRRTDELIEKYTGTRPWLFRPPYIDQNQSMHDAVKHTFINGVGCQDWEADRSAQTRFEDLMLKVKDGDIILLHDFTGNDNTVEALRLIIPELKKRGYRLVTVSRLFEMKGVSPEAHNGVLYSNVLQ